MTRPQGFASDAYGQLTAAQATRDGASRSSLSRAARSGRLERPYRGVYAVPGAGDENAMLRAAMAHLGPESTAVLGSAALTHGLAGLPRRWRPQVALPPGMERRQRDNLDLHVWRLDDSEVELVDGIRVTSVVRTLADVCRILPMEQAVCVVDSALDRRAIAPESLAEVRRAMSGRRGCRSGVRALDLARPGAQSPGETRVRLLAAAAGLPPDALQVPVRNPAGAVIAYADLGYRLPSGRWVLVEFDGRSVHELPTALLADRRRQNAILTESGGVIVRFAWEDTMTVNAVPDALRPILTSAGWRPGQYRA